MKRRKYHLIIFLISFGLTYLNDDVFAQTRANQLWVGILPNYTFKNKVNYSGQFDYRRVLNQNDNWQRFFNLNDFRVFSINWLDVQTGSFFLYTYHGEAYHLLDAWEIRPFVGARFHITKDRRINLRNYLRLEERLFFFTNINKFETTTRIRDRIEVIAALNKSNLNLGKVIYLNLDAEFYLNTIGKPEEKFINYFQARMGPGYRFNYQWRLEIYYVIQLIKISVLDHFETQSNVLNIRLKYFMN